MSTRATYILAAAVILGSAARTFGSELALGSAAAQPGQTITVPVTYTPKGDATAAALTTDLRFDAKALSHPRCESGSALTGGEQAGKTVKCVERQPGMLRLLVYGLNLGPVPAGEIARVSFDVAAGARPRSYRLRHRATAADANGNDFTLRHRDGTVRVGGR